MKIEKTYEQNVSFGANTYESAKVSVKIISDKEVTPAEFPEFSAKLGQLAKIAVQKELEQIKKEYLEKKANS